MSDLVLRVRNTSPGLRSVYSDARELVFVPGTTSEVSVTAHAAMIIRRHPDLRILDAVDEWLEQRVNGAEAPQPPLEGRPPLVVMGMMGLGDNIHQRAVLRALMHRYDVTLATCWGTLYHDLVAQGLKLTLRRSHLHAQAKNQARERDLLTAPLPPRGTETRTLSYAPVEIARHGSVLAAMFASAGLAMPERPDFSLPVPEAWRTALRALLPATNGKPIMVHRPAVLRREWDCRNRNPDPVAFDALFRSIAERFFVVSIADLEDGLEWLDGPPYQSADLVWHKGELDFPHLAALFAEAALVFSPAGFGPILAAAVGTPSVTVFGGYESSRTIRVGRDPAKSLFVDTDQPCSCFSHRHACRKQITLSPALERLAAFVAPLAGSHLGAPAAPRPSIPPQPPKPHPRPSIAGRGAVSRVCIVVGGAATVLDELAEAKRLCAEAGEDPTIIAVNDMAVLLPDQIVFASLHHHKIGGWLADRTARGYPPPAEVWGWFRPPGMPNIVTHVTADLQGSGGLFGIAVALQRGHTRVIAAGIPMEGSAGHIVRGYPWADCDRYRKGWEDNMTQIIGRVRSISGWTAARLGRPDRDWLGS